MAGFLLEGKQWPGKPVELSLTDKLHEAVAHTRPVPVPIGTVDAAVVEDMLQIAAPSWLAETDTYGIKLIELKNDAVREGWQDVYIVRHKMHGVTAQSFSALPHAITYMQEIQKALDEVLGKNVQKN